MKLLPVQVDNPPAFYPQRTQFLNVIKDKLIKNGYDGNRAIEIERSLADKESKFTYPMSIRRIVKQIEDKKLDKAPASDTEYLKNLNKLLIPLETLKKNGFPVDIVGKGTLPDSVTCERCKVKFPPNNNATKTVPCEFHLLKREYDISKKKLNNYFPCCNGILGQSVGCEARNFHVFKLQEFSEMANISKFVESTNENGEFAIGLDCEMCFTSLGFEMVRLTMVNLDGKVVLDKLVKPVGEVWDLNTRFSGVSSLENALTLDELYTEMFKIVGKNTILIGHGLQNDLCVLRLVHFKIVDTALLYPPFRQRTFSLKDLSFDYLSRKIQGGEHSSEEDAVAAVDIVKFNLKKESQRIK